MRRIFYSILTLLTLLTPPLALAQQQIATATNNTEIVGDTYPHITALENAILGQTFIAEPLTNRLSRMEKKAFGAVSTKTDLSERTDALDDYTTNQLHKNLLQANVDADTTDTQTSLPEQGQSISQTPGDYPRVTALEQAILGQTFAGQPLADRLSRMEVKAFGSASTNLDLSDRTDKLETYAQKKLHFQPLANNTQDDTATANSQKGGLLSKVGQALLGMAGGAGPGIGGVGVPGGMGFGGLGSGFGGMGRNFGGVNVGRRQPQQQQAEPPVAVHPEDPAIFQPNPPDASAKLITKVGWCEVKVFGHTFPNVHLPERLGQLNNELKLEPGKSDVQLMDDIGLMIKAVQARKPSINQL